MGGCCTKREILTVSYKKNNPSATRRNSIFLENFCKQEDYKKKYEYISILGNGGFGKVRLYRDRQAKDLKFAIKTLKKDFINPHNIVSLIEEVNILRDLDHPNIVKYFETYEDDLYIHIVMEYIPGDNLFKVVTNRKYNQFNEKNAAEIMKCLLKAIMFLHNMNIVHRDIKPENILFSLTGSYESLKLIDFGLSAAKTNMREKYRVGSPYYMAPEMIQGNFTFESDCWSIGVILYEMMTGKHPFDGKTQEEIFKKILNGFYDTNLLERQKCSNDVKDLIKKLIVLDPMTRLSVQQALEHTWLKTYAEQEKSLSTILDDGIIESLKTFANSNPLQKEIMFYLAKISSEKEIQKLKQAFLRIDKDNTGTIEMEEVIEIFEQMGIKRNMVKINLFKDQEEIQEIWEGMDFHNDGKVNYSEFLAATLSSVQFSKEEKLWSAFKYFDTTNTGFITSDSVIETLKNSNLRADEAGLIDAFNSFKKEGKLNFEEFKKIMK